MSYSIHITPRAEYQLENLVSYLLVQFQSKQGASHLLDSIDHIYARMEENPFQFPESDDEYLKSKRYREAKLTGMKYKIIFKVEDQDVYILGIFHDGENYLTKM